MSENPICIIWLQHKTIYGSIAMAGCEMHCFNPLANLFFREKSYERENME